MDAKITSIVINGGQTGDGLVTTKEIFAYSMRLSREYDGWIEYEVDEVAVDIEGFAYKCISSTLGHPLTNTTYWEPMEQIVDKYLDCDYIYELTLKYHENYTEDLDVKTTKVFAGSRWFKIMPDGMSILTDKYLWTRDGIVYLPNNGKLSIEINDVERVIGSNDNLVVSLPHYTHSRNIHKLTSDGKKSSLWLNSIW